MGITRTLMRSARVAAICLALIQTVVAQGPVPAKTQDPVEAAHVEFAMSGSELDALEGQVYDVLLKNGKQETGATLKGFLTGKQQLDRFRSIELTLAGQTKSRKYPADQIIQLVKEGNVYPVALLPSQKMYVLIDANKQNESIIKRLVGEGYDLHKNATPEEQAQFVTEEKEFLDKVKAHFSTLTMQVVETDNFLFLSDLPAGQMNQTIKQLDKMGESLVQLIGRPPGVNFWFIRLFGGMGHRKALTL